MSQPEQLIAPTYRIGLRAPQSLFFLETPSLAPRSAEFGYILQLSEWRPLKAIREADGLFRKDTLASNNGSHRGDKHPPPNGTGVPVYL